MPKQTRRDIDEVIADFRAAFASQSPEWRAGANAALQAVIKIGSDFGGDAIDLAECVRELVVEE